jgi:tRNA-splicing ligase RtcB
VGNKKLADAMTSKQLGELEGIQRHLALSKSLVANSIRICRTHKRADAKLAVNVLITLLCDNNQGLCSLTIKRMAELLDRTEENIRLAIRTLEADGTMNVNKTVGGLPNTYWPSVPRAVALERHFGHAVWVTRKGAVRAGVGDLGIIPGSMGAKSYIVRGKGNQDSFQSCAHGAGRRMSRGEAKRRFSLQAHAAATSGIECRKDEA